MADKAELISVIKSAQVKVPGTEDEMLIFFLGLLLGVLLGGTLCVTYLRQEIAAGISPKLKRVERQLDTIETQLNLAAVTRYTALSVRAQDDISRQLTEHDDR